MTLDNDVVDVPPTVDDLPPADEGQTPPPDDSQENPPTAGDKNPVPPADKPKVEDEAGKKTFTQEKLNEIVRSRLDKDRQSFFNRYGVKDRDGLDGLIGKAQSYDVMKERYENQKTKIAQLEEKLAFKSNDINPEREDDIRAYFKGKGLEFNEEALVNELATHPEWRNVVQADDKPKTGIKVLGVEHDGHDDVPETESEKQKRIFGV